MEGKAMDPLRHHILEAVDCLRQRKCRPDRESIAHYVLRKFGSSMNEIFAELENIVDENGLIKVEYKGTTSYRSPSSFDTKNSPLLTKHSKILNSSKTTRFILTGINELLVKDPNYAKEGVPLIELKEALVGFDGVRFGDDNMDVVLEREKNYGTIQIAKSTILTDSLRVFPKDIPVPEEMLKHSLSADILPSDKDDKKPRKPRKSNAAAGASTAAGGTPPVKKAPKGKGKKEVIEEKKDVKPVAVFAVKSEPQLENETNDNINVVTEGLPPKKNPRLTSAGRKTIAAKVAESVKSTLEGESDFETKSAQMIKLAAAVVKPVEEAPNQKVPMLVLAESIKGKNSNGETLHEVDSLEPNVEEINNVNRSSPVGGKKRRGRPPVSLETDNNKEDKDDDIKEERDEDYEMDNDKASPSNDQGLTRSKRDKRKKQVFDPSDLPKTYSNYSNSLKSTRKSRANRSPSYEEPPAKKAVVARPSRASSRKIIPVESEEKRVSRSNSKKANDESKTNKNLKPVETITDETPEEPEHMDTDTEKEDIKTTEMETQNDEETENKSVDLEEVTSPVCNTETQPITSTKIEKRCEYCPETKNKDKPVDGAVEDFLTCASCLANIHPGCMDYSSELTTRIRELHKREGSKRIPWKCFDCKTCGTCQRRLFGLSLPSTKRASTSKIESTSSDEKGDKSNALQFILCENCDVGFHAKCIKMETNALKKAWICQECKTTMSTIDVKKQIPVKGKNTKKPIKKKQVAEEKGNKRVGRSLRIQSKPALDVLKKKEIPKPIITKAKVETTKSKEKIISGSEDENSDAQAGESSEESDTLDITSWSPSDVEAFFIEKGLKDEAAILKEQDVDGYSILLLKREDIIHGLRLRLGPALKVNRLINELQAKAPVRAKWPDEESTEHEEEALGQDISQR